MSVNKLTEAIMEFVSKYIKEGMENDVDFDDDWPTQQETLHKLMKKLIKKKKDPNHPAHPKSDYIFYCNIHRPRVQKELQDALVLDNEHDVEKVQPHDVTRRLAKEWDDLKKNKLKEKQLYEEMAKKDKKRYDDEMADYSPPVNNEVAEEPKKGRKKKSDDGRPKKPKSGYLLFCDDMRPTVKKDFPTLKPTQVLSKLGELWQACSEDEQAPYLEKAEKLKKTYKEDMDNWKLAVPVEQEALPDEDPNEEVEEEPEEKPKKGGRKKKEVEEKPKKKEEKPKKEGKKKTVVPKPKKGRKKAKAEDDDE